MRWTVAGIVLTVLGCLGAGWAGLVGFLVGYENGAAASSAYNAFGIIALACAAGGVYMIKKGGRLKRLSQATRDERAEFL